MPPRPSSRAVEEAGQQHVVPRHLAARAGAEDMDFRLAREPLDHGRDVANAAKKTRLARRHCIIARVPLVVVNMTVLPPTDWSV